MNCPVCHLSLVMVWKRFWCHTFFLVSLRAKWKWPGNHNSMARRCLFFVVPRFISNCDWLIKNSITVRVYFSALFTNLNFPNSLLAPLCIVCSLLFPGSFLTVTDCSVTDLTYDQSWLIMGSPPHQMIGHSHEIIDLPKMSNILNSNGFW